MIYLDVLFLGFIWVFILDVSGFMDSVKSSIIRFLKVGKSDSLRLKPFDCSLCMTFWSGLIYLLYVRGFTIFNIAYVLLIACSTPLIKDVFYLFFDAFQFVISKLSGYIR